ncbi:hypothetical protein H6P81_020428 [Aristolochia fimbriata]|uniref:ABC transporter B family member 29, chloroplastic n=1 Tax=Aristolochia fimbriata TaxID=158543 RepID=A0AAV7DVD8_ARIFI|nr:hypothetical protein H6P81_020428 [Aristolochia fimbriata]
MVWQAAKPAGAVSLASPTDLKSPRYFPRRLKNVSSPSRKFPSSIKFSMVSSCPGVSEALKPDSKLQSDRPFISFSSLVPITPYLMSEWEPILKGWICSAVSVYCLSKYVPTVGKFTSIFASVDANRFTREGLTLAGLVLVRCAGSYLQQAFLWEAALNSAYRIRVYVFRKVLERDLGFFEGTGGVAAGDIAYRVTAEASDVADTVYAVLSTIVPSTLQIIAMAAQMLVASPVLSLMSALAIPCMSLVIAYLGERLRKISRKAHLSVAELSGYINEVLPRILVVKSNNAELCEVAQFQRFAHIDLTEHLKKKKMKSLVPQIVQVMYTGTLLVFCIGSLVVSRGSIDCSQIVSFVTSLVLLIEPVQGIGKAYNEFKQGEPAIDRLFDLTRFNHQVIEKPDAVDIDSVTGDIKFCGVTFKYGENMPFVLQQVNLHIRPGQTVALVGPSGGGKTTLTKLLLRLYEPLSGCILLDDLDIGDITLASLRRHISLVSQDIALFSGSVAENIGYRDFMGKINMEQVMEAAKIANADEFIQMLPEGYNTNIGPRGSLLSGGQKQRLAIARALYQNSSILILDEATSALDHRTEKLVRQAVERLLDNHTVLVIAHRLETVLMADRVLVLEGGKLEEIPPSSLLGQGLSNDSLLSSGLII